MKKREGRVMGLAVTGLAVFILIYTYYYTSTYRPLHGPVGDLTVSMALSITAVLAGMLIELGRLWGWVIEFKVDPDLLVMHGVPAAILGLIPGPLWLQSGGKVFPFTFFADPVVTGIAGVWLGVVLFRGFFDHKRVRDEEETQKNAGEPGGT